MKKSKVAVAALVLAATLVVPSVNTFAVDEEYVEAAKQIEIVDEVVEEDGISALSESLDEGLFDSDIELYYNTEETEETEEYNLVTRTQSWQMANLGGIGYYNPGTPITIVKATLNDGEEKEVYVVGMSGTAFVENQATGIVNDLLAGFNFTNPYLRAVRKAVTENIPADSNLIFTGHSLGGMIAQEAAADSTIKKNYNVLYTVTFGAPLISAGFREGKVQRLGDTSDFIPYLSVSGTILAPWQIKGLNRENGGYGKGIKNGWTAHCNSYEQERIWHDYDVLGYKYGNATLTYDTGSIMHFAAPTRW